ncbi:MAG: multiheme c-type cytochrome [Candidatus Aminicenantes bacterium]|nr:multiheme c-type cytochrome [Candidatus Aminicenantes bacterium]
MKKAIVSLALALAVLTAIAAAQTPTYVGADKCALCHKTERQGLQFVIWQGAKHAKSFATLSSPQAAQNAQALGVAKPAEDPKCLKCHAPLHDKAPALMAEGVTCEVCHGPGSDYKALAVMKNREESAKKGLILFPNPDDIKAQCLKCHENAHGLTFDFAAAWAKIKHPIPAK